ITSAPGLRRPLRLESAPTYCGKDTLSRLANAPSRNARFARLPDSAPIFSCKLRTAMWCEVGSLRIACPISPAIDKVGHPLAPPEPKNGGMVRRPRADYGAGRRRSRFHRRLPDVDLAGRYVPPSPR